MNATTTHERISDDPEFTALCERVLADWGKLLGYVQQHGHQQDKNSAALTDSELQAGIRYLMGIDDAV